MRNFLNKIKCQHLAWFNIIFFIIFILNIISILPFWLFEDKFQRSIRTFWGIPKYWWREFHYIIGGWLLIFIFIHLILHWNYLKNITLLATANNFVKKEENTDQK